MQKRLICDQRFTLVHALQALYKANWGPAGNRAVYQLQQALLPVQAEWQTVVKKILDAHKKDDVISPEGMTEYDTLFNTMGAEEFEVEKIKLMRGTAFDNVTVAEMNVLDAVVDWT
jgi:hypothetical protein